jgi:hypothetical protein
MSAHNSQKYIRKFWLAVKSMYFVLTKLHYTHTDVRRTVVHLTYALGLKC